MFYSIFIMLSKPSPLVNSRISLSSPKETLSPLSSHSPLPTLVATDLLSDSKDLPVLDISHKWSHTACVASCVWLLSLSIRLARFRYDVACASTLFRLMAKQYLTTRTDRVCLSGHQLVNVWVVSTFWLL